MIHAAIAAATVTVGLPLLVIAGVAATSPQRTGEQPTDHALHDIPATYLAWYQQAAATCPGLPWSVLAAIGKVESDHGRGPDPGIRSGANSKGAMGPMQFLRPTWTQYGIDGNHDGAKNVYDPADAIPAAANMLCADGAKAGTEQGLRKAIWAYNHAGWYVDLVLKTAATYATSAGSGNGAIAVQAAEHWIGTPYSWGGGGMNGPSYGTAQGAGIDGFDCSGLTQYAWARAGIHLDRVAAAQYNDGLHVPRDQLEPGDLLFFAHNPGDPATIHHVALYTGNGQMIEAPHSGEAVRISQFAGNPYREAEYAGAVRPINQQ